jgi:hypothetical protein
MKTTDIIDIATPEAHGQRDHRIFRRMTETRYEHIQDAFYLGGYEAVKECLQRKPGEKLAC